jgi:glyoxylase-like metal-dependent hydrolase (beta-lactamase superfamily II)
VSVGPDGVFLIDDQYAPLTDRILEAIGRITPEPVRFVLNTHWHGDHTGGNENLGRAGAVIVAHENVRERMSVEQVLERVGRPVATTPASPGVALPVVTFTEDVTFHLNGDEIRAFHVEHAHTDGDVIVHFRGADVVHMGDTFFRDRFPFIDTATGGSIDGVIAAAGRALGLIGPDTKVIPGHGALSTRADLMAYRDALQAMRDEVETILNEGHPLEHLLDFRPLRVYAEAWGQDRAAEDTFVETIYHGLEAR